MAKKIIAISIIFLCTSIIWVILGGINLSRTSKTENSLSKKMEALWGESLKEKEPGFFMISSTPKSYEEKDQYGRIKYITKNEEKKDSIIPIKSDINCEINYEPRKKGLKWFSSYTIKYKALYIIIPSKQNINSIRMEYDFPSQNALFDNFNLIINGEVIKDLQFENTDYNPTKIIKDVQYTGQEDLKIEISYLSRGLNNWTYLFGDSISQVKDFNLEMLTNFKKIDFPGNCISPTTKTELKDGWKLTWKYSNLLSGYSIGLKMPKKNNPGEIASRISFFGPVSLLFFFSFIFFITIILDKNLHPMHFFFLAASFFSFHLFFSYTVDHFNIYICFILASLISLFLVGFYISMIHGIEFTLIYITIPQFIYLVLFTFSHFFEGYTGLTVTIASIITLFILMKLTAKIDWEFKK